MPIKAGMLKSMQSTPETMPPIGRKSGRNNPTDEALILANAINAVTALPLSATERAALIRRLAGLP